MTDAFERKILRQVSGPVQADGVRELDVRRFTNFMMILHFQNFYA
jgi:hypothetical protein